MNIVTFITKARRGKTILEIADKYDIKIKAPCKKGKCGKCLVKVKGDLKEITKEEKKLLSEKKLLEGYRLACVAEINGDIEIELD
jgi:ferredoxin